MFTAVTMKNAVFWEVTLCGSCKNRHFGGSIASIIRIKRIGELRSVFQLLVTANILLGRWFFSSLCWRRYVFLKRRFLQDPHCESSQKSAFFTSSYSSDQTFLLLCRFLNWEYLIHRYSAIGSFVWNAANICDSRHYLSQGDAIISVLVVIIDVIIRKCFNFRAIDFTSWKFCLKLWAYLWEGNSPWVAFPSTVQFRCSIDLC
jgi:hypothetical protein